MGNKATGIAAPRACPCNDLLADAGSCRAVPNIGRSRIKRKIQQWCHDMVIDHFRMLNMIMSIQFISILPMQREKVLASKHGNESDYTNGCSLYFAKVLQATVATLCGSKPPLSPFKFLSSTRLSIQSELLQHKFYVEDRAARRSSPSTI